MASDFIVMDGYPAIYTFILTENIYLYFRFYFRAFQVVNVF